MEIARAKKTGGLILPSSRPLVAHSPKACLFDFVHPPAALTINLINPLFSISFHLVRSCQNLFERRSGGARLGTLSAYSNISVSCSHYVSFAGMP
jgi:hypothetical protein